MRKTVTIRLLLRAHALLRPCLLLTLQVAIVELPEMKGRVFCAHRVLTFSKKDSSLARLVRPRLSSSSSAHDKQGGWLWPAMGLETLSATSSCLHWPVQIKHFPGNHPSSLSCTAVQHPMSVWSVYKATVVAVVRAPRRFALVHVAHDVHLLPHAGTAHLPTLHPLVRLGICTKRLVSTTVSPHTKVRREQ